MEIAIIGAGLTGLTAGYRLSEKGHRVVIFEKEKFAGGLATGFKKENWDWHLESFFHHLFTSDQAVKKLLKDLDLETKLFYLRPKTSIFYQGKIFQFDSPFSVLKFPLLNFPKRLRTGLITLFLKTYPDWRNFEKIKASSWLEKYYGKEAYQILWQPLLKSKFGDQADKVSMVWFWARIKKRSANLGYLEGGFQTLIEKLVEKIKENGGRFYLNTDVTKITSDGGRLSLRSHDSSEVAVFDKIIITTPTKTFFPKTKLPEMLGALNLIFELKEPFFKDNTYWLNVNEENFPFVAVVEHTHFIDSKFYGGHHLVYIGGYYPQNHRYFKMTKEQILKEFLPYLQKINPRFNLSSVFSLQSSVASHAQPVIPVNYPRIIPLHQTPIKNVFLTNMQQVYPWDRGVNYAIEFGNNIAKLVHKS
jgi:protoporphyrinogen oxidase